MDFAYRSHDVFVEFNPGETKTWRLPPMTPGAIIISSVYAMPPGWHPTSSSTPTEHHGPGGVHHGHGGSVGGPVAEPEVALPGDGTVHLDQPAFPTHGNLDTLILDPDGGGSIGPTMELVLELLRGGQPVTDVNPQVHTILHKTLNSGDIWTLRISRKQDGSMDRRRYRIHAQYPSYLPLEVRRIPMRFFRRGFEENWNSGPYIEWAYIKDNVLSYQWDRQFAALYDKPADNQHHRLLDSGTVKLPHIRAINMRLLAGGGVDPSSPPLIPGQIQSERPYFALRIDCTYEGSRDIVIDTPGPNVPNITLPDPLWIDIRFFIEAAQGMIGYSPWVSSPLLDMLDFNVTYPTLSLETETINVKNEIKQSLEKYLYGLQLGPAGFLFDKYIRPWIVGRYEVEKVAYNRVRDETEVTYVGRRPMPLSGDPPLAMDHHLEVSTGDTTLPEFPKLFDTPDEMPRTGGTGFSDPLLLHQATNPGALSKVKHIVVLMQENRSFDQVLGYLSRDGMMPRENLFLAGPGVVRQSPQEHVDGLLPGDDNTRDRLTYPENSQSYYRPEHTGTTAWPDFGLSNPCHGHDCVERQISDGMKGFVADYARKVGNNRERLQLIMNYLTDAELPAYGALTREFAICDHWFGAHIGGTLPNRFISLAGDLSEDLYGSPEVENPDLVDGFAPNEATTFFDHLTNRNVSWKLFEHGYSMLRLFRNYTFDETNIVGFKNPTDGFVATARAGRLPAVTFIEPDYIEFPDGNDDHAPADMKNGQRLIATIVRALLDSPHWEETLLIITYDEHGGFYDHMPLPYEVTSTAADGTVTTRSIPPLSNGERRLGPRVPTFVISPFVAPMTNGKVNVSKTIYDHTTIPATILRCFCSPHPPSMGPRADGAADLRDLLTLDTARPRSDFDQLVRELDTVANGPVVSLNGNVPAAPLRKPKGADLEDDFHGLIAFASSITGVGHR